MNLSHTLQKARAYESHSLAAIPETQRPVYHLTPAVGWMNDPNGFSWYQGKYHLFYQYYPYDLRWGPMHWGHAVSTDLLHWEHLPCAMAPDTSYDGAGCFSGSAITMPDGRHMLMYTGVARKEQPDGSWKEFQTQCLAFGDGENYEKYAGNPVLDARHLPEGGSPADFRDPKIWQEEDGSYRCVAANRPADGGGSVLLFRSEDGIHWDFETTLDQSRNQLGGMWECPDFFLLDGKALILTSPMNMCATKDTDFHNGNGNIYLTGSFDAVKGQFIRESVAVIDHGLEFYAPQTLLAPDGRRIMTAWMQSWDSCTTPVRPAGAPPWLGQMVTPRELSIKDGKLIQTPVRELANAHTGRVAHSVALSGEAQLPGVEGRILDMTVSVKPGTNGYDTFSIFLAADGQYETVIRYHRASSTLSLDRTYSGFCRDVPHQRQCAVRDAEGQLTLRILLDRYSLEIFVNGGEQTLTNVLYTPETAEGIRFACDGQVQLDVEKYTLAR